MIVVINKQKLKEDIIKAGFNLTILAQNIGCSKAHLSSILNHERNPGPIIAVKICEQINGKFEDYFFVETVHKEKQKTKQTHK